MRQVDGEQIVETARLFLGRTYTQSFNCVDFVRAVYRVHRLTVPTVAFNISQHDLINPPIGFVLFLKHKKVSDERRWTHIALIASRDSCIHCSYFFGERVVVTKIVELLRLYDVAC